MREGLGEFGRDWADSDQIGPAPPRLVLPRSPMQVVGGARRLGWKLRIDSSVLAVFWSRASAYFRATAR